MQKDTNKLLEELKSFSDFREFYSKNDELFSEMPIGEYISRIIDERGLVKSEVIAKSEISEIYAYQILSGVRKSPSRNKVLCFALALGLNYEQTQQMLSKTGYANLYIKNPFDCIVIYGLCKGYSVLQVNDLLYDYGQELLG